MIDSSGSLLAAILTFFIIFGIPLIVFILLLVRAHKKGKNIKYILKGVSILFAVILVIIITSNIYSGIRGKQNMELGAALNLKEESWPIMMSAIYNNDKLGCNYLNDPWNKVCVTAFVKSYDTCEETFNKDEDLSTLSPLWGCYEGVLWLTADVSTCTMHHNSYKNLCEMSYDKMLNFKALLDMDNNYCEKIMNNTKKTMCKEDFMLLYKTSEVDMDSALKDLNQKRYNYYDDLYKIFKMKK